MSVVSSRERHAMRHAYAAAAQSPARSTQTGAALLLEDGSTLLSCNGFPAGVDPEAEAVHERPRKDQLIVHAERNAIYGAARLGIRTIGLTMVACWAPCAGCAQAIAVAGIGRLVVHGERVDATPARCRDDVRAGLWMLDRAGVEVVRLEGPVNAGITILFDGEEIHV